MSRSTPRSPKRRRARSRTDTTCPACALDAGAGSRDGDGNLFLRGVAEGVRITLYERGLSNLCPRHQEVFDRALDVRGVELRRVEPEAVKH